jgi:hypothetical protein
MAAIDQPENTKPDDQEACANLDLPLPGDESE